ncbi:AEC family transporter [Geomicrobium sp. JCM 19038]|uniref:AEC family transporter n=1 Tax=Geomicrobium sp. JCM 19038 TaxID=1460635 RepID=UPI00045F2001|nr:hypothetical protein [Geomicrobium sp. JCM 19038]GAK07148.1 hypothetical protein JCM19038_868 [Geomicrobium sp. JCM 19038]
MPAWVPVAKVLRVLTFTVLLGLMPIVLIGAFWNVDFRQTEFLILPVIGVFTIFLGGGLALVASKIHGLTREQTGSMILAGAFINLGSFGALFSVFFIGIEALPFVILFRLFEEIVYYAICYPIAKSFGPLRHVSSSSGIKRIIKDPFIMVTFSALCIGALLNFSPLEYGSFYDTINSILVPLSAILLLVPVGFSMKLGAVRTHMKPSGSIALIKHIIVPITVTSIAYFIGLGNYGNGIILYVVLILSSMPPAVSSLVPPQLFKLDVDLANAAWVVSMCSLAFTLPILYVVTNVL